MSSPPSSGPDALARIVSRWARPVFFAALAFASVMAWLPHPPRLPGEPCDKIQHVATFLTLGFLSMAAVPTARPTILLAALAAYGALIELVQMIPALNRDGDWRDWIADVAAVLVALGVGRLILWLRRRRVTPVPERDG